MTKRNDNPAPSHSVSEDAVENTRKIGVVKCAESDRRLSVAHLSDKVRARIVELMEFHESSEVAAVQARREFIGIRISARLVIEVMVLCGPRLRKPPASEVSVMQMRRSA